MRRASYASRLSSALSTLLAFIATGWEFPDACSKAALRWDVDYDELRDLYDEQ